MPGCAGALGSEHHGGVAEGVHGVSGGGGGGGRYEVKD